MSFEEGPYVQVACFCETVIQDVKGSFSLIRVVDTIEHSVSGPNPPAEMPPFQFRLNLVLMLKSGMAQGRWDLKIVPQLPTGETGEPLLFTAHFEGDEKGQNFIIDFSFVVKHEGIHWFKVYLGDDLLTAIPLRVKYSRQIIGQTIPR
ncbi:DUF6941 family protein [Anaerolinea sp.]|uniref:DUF6941 family protein n=1 Tax=Anaerolinea sp. TaxID=1872519 RepID=UPI002ACEFA71|nr:hypothetical protein [Anaerolinea sp.]